MTTTTALPTTARNGAPIVSNPGQQRHLEAIALRHEGRTWQEVAAATGYATASSAEAAVMRYVAWRNGNTTTRRTLARNAVPTWSLTRSFGVEIEFRGITARAAAIALEPVLGTLLQVRRYHAAQSAGTYDQWSLELDGSVTYTQRSTGLNIGGELVSPVLSGPERFAQLTAVMNALTAAGAKVDRATGMHVHVDARDLTGEQIARFIGAYVDRQADFDEFVSPSRRNNRRYCQNMSEPEKAQVKDSFKARREAPGYMNRYRTVNCTAFARLGTIEFRQHHGTTNPKKAIAWVETLLAMANSVLATADETLPTGSPAELIRALVPFGLTETSARQMTGRLA